MASHPLVPLSLRTFLETYPETELTVTENGSADLRAYLQKGGIDVAILRSSHTSTSLVEDAVLDERMVFAMASKHQLAGLRALTLGQLRSETFVARPQAVDPDVHEVLISIQTADGSGPHIGCTVADLGALLAAVAAGRGISILPVTDSSPRSEVMKFIPLAIKPPRSSRLWHIE